MINRNDHRMNTVAQIGVLVIDDSALVRRAFQAVLASDPEVEFLGAAPDPIFARRLLEKRWPDVILLDLEMPRQDGLSFLRELMRERPTPVLVCSSLTQAGAKATVDALAAGAFTTFAKPASGVGEFLQQEAPELLRLIHEAAGSRPSAPIRVGTGVGSRARTPPRRGGRSGSGIVLVGASTGGVQAVEALVTALSPDTPPVLVVQHMPPFFTRAFAERLDRQTRLHVREAEENDIPQWGQVLIAPGDRHTLVSRVGAGYQVVLQDSPPVNRHRPAVDVLFQSGARCGGGPSMMGVLLTGMGRDGAEGLLALRRAGALTVAQDRASSVVFGMPGAAVELGAAMEVLSLDRIAGRIERFAMQARQ